ncbi:NfeD family protein [Thalassomonas actiniarum]|uniref:NfeD family protein n=1 Tax=Thalassomonas actiniarum TaxID=485447 RepID=A0AAF0C310_9GAMM|nr:NfeD family protein [Thalassomonas actiniarum]WDD98410.1 NfeD family protein [Thalassomonas actiniarum]
MELILSFQAWLILALILTCAEFVVPGGILFNLGLASLIVALGVKFQLLDTWPLTLTAWFIIASVLLFVMYFVTERFFSDTKRIDNTFEEVDSYGKEVTVVEKIGPGNHPGRVEFQGTTWKALSDGSEIAAGSRVTIVCKDNISLIVESPK